MLLQVFDIAVTVKKLTMGTLEGVVEVNAGMLPVPEVDANPMAGLLIVQLYIVLATFEPLKIIEEIWTPLQTTRSGIGSRPTTGLT